MGASDGEVDAQRQAGTTVDPEVSDRPVRAGRYGRQVDRPAPVRAKVGVHVVELGELTIHHDEVQAHLVHEMERPDRPAVAALDDESKGAASRGEDRRLGNQPVALHRRDDAISDGCGRLSYVRYRPDPRSGRRRADDRPDEQRPVREEPTRDAHRSIPYPAAATAS